MILNISALIMTMMGLWMYATTMILFKVVSAENVFTGPTFQQKGLKVVSTTTTRILKPAPRQTGGSFYFLVTTFMISSKNYSIVTAMQRSLTFSYQQVTNWKA